MDILQQLREYFQARGTLDVTHLHIDMFVENEQVQQAIDELEKRLLMQVAELDELTSLEQLAFILLAKGAKIDSD